MSIKWSGATKAPSREPGMKLTIATGDYAHTRGLGQPGRRVHERREIAIDHVVDKPAAIFRRALQEPLPYDVAEMSLATTYVLAARGDPRFVALPVFTSRMFRHSAFYVREGVRRPEDLKGGRIGVVRYGMTAAVWARALLAEGYGIVPGELEWWIGERQFFRPSGVTLNEADGPAALEAMLVAGELDCLLSVGEPAAFRAGQVRRLFPDFGAAEKAHYRRTGIHPIMHTVLVKRALVDAHPWLPPVLLAAFDDAKQAALEWITDTDASSLPVPFQHGWATEVRALMNGDPWPYGLEPNRKVLARFGELMHAQGLTERTLEPEEVFLVV